MTRRDIVVVDVETSALVPNSATNPLGTPAGDYGVVVEVAWWNLNSNATGSFVPMHNVHLVRAYGSAQALVVNRYLERLVDVEQDTCGTEMGRLHTALGGEESAGATLAGSNPAFDAMFLRQMFADRFRPSQPWHHRLLDLSAFTAGKLGLDPGELPGLATVCKHLGVDPPNHTATSDVRATGECFLKLGAVKEAA